MNRRLKFIAQYSSFASCNWCPCWVLQDSSLATQALLKITLKQVSLRRLMAFKDLLYMQSRNLTDKRTNRKHQDSTRTISFAWWRYRSFKMTLSRFPWNGLTVTNSALSVKQLSHLGPIIAHFAESVSCEWTITALGLETVLVSWTTSSFGFSYSTPASDLV